MRGKVTRTDCVLTRDRITPAYAGKRFQKSLARATEGDHPRICGEKSLSGTDTGRKEGSPPHMRGKGYQLVERLQQVGITPAYAGKSPRLHEK